MAERLKRAKGVGWQTFEGVAVLLNPRRDMVHEFNRTGTWIWERLDGNRGHETLAEGLAAEFGIDLGTADAHLTEFETQLRELELVEAQT